MLHLASQLTDDQVHQLAELKAQYLGRIEEALASRRMEGIVVTGLHLFGAGNGVAAADLAFGTVSGLENGDKSAEASLIRWIEETKCDAVVFHGTGDLIGNHGETAPVGFYGSARRDGPTEVHTCVARDRSGDTPAWRPGTFTHSLAIRFFEAADQAWFWHPNRCVGVSTSFSELHMDDPKASALAAAYYRRRLGPLPEGVLNSLGGRHGFGAALRAAALVSLDVEPDDEDCVYNRAFTAYRWFESGLPVFDLTASLTAALSLTDSANIPFSLVRPPFAAAYVRLPRPFWVVDLAQAPCGKADIVGFWYTRMTFSVAGEAVDGVRFLVLLDNGEPHAGSRTFDLVLPARESEMDSRFVAEWLEAARKAANPETAAVTALAVNLWLYLAEQKTAPSMPNPARRVERDPSARSAPRVVVLGHEVKLDGDLLKLGRHVVTQGVPTGKTWKLKTGHVVRAHWRHRQVCGSRKRLPGGGFTPWPERRAKWIREHRKGEGPLLQHLYQVKGKEGGENQRPKH